MDGEEADKKEKRKKNKGRNQNKKSIITLAEKKGKKRR